MINKNKIQNIGFNFEHSYSNLSKNLIKEIKPSFVSNPKLIILNNSLAREINLDFTSLNESEISSLLSGNVLPEESKCIAQAYAGHQFGFFTMLGDGRAIIIGEHISNTNEKFDIQFKGSGKTPYSRNGDGKATLVSMLREYLISESMNALGIPTTRSLAVVSSGESLQRERKIKGGVLTRIASSHIRVGTFQYLSMNEDLPTLNKLILYCLNRHYTNYKIDINPAITLLKIVRDRQISLIVNWMRVGFIHGVMNTDNMTISGETIDYGPCAFMNAYDPGKFFSSIDINGRYSFKNQSLIAHWNISRFAETLIPFLNPSRDKAIEIGKEIIDEFEDLFNKKWLYMMKSKLGFINEDKNDYNLIKEILNFMQNNKIDYTNTFINLMNEKNIDKDLLKNNSFQQIKNKIKKRLLQNSKSKKFIKDIMIKNNPLVIPRNHLVEKALIDVENNENYIFFNELLSILKNPYTENDNIKKFQSPPDKNFENQYQTFCGT